MRSETFDTPGPVRLSLDVPVGRIEIDTDSGTTTRVELEAVSKDMQEIVEDARIELRERHDGQEVAVEVQSRFGIFISFGRSQDIRLRVVCPHGTDVDAMTKSADLVARGRYGDVRMKTASGDANIDDVDGELQFKSASGDLHAGHVVGGARVQTASGDVAVDEVDGDLSAQLVSGDLWIRDARSSVNANTVSGDQRLDAVSSGNMDLRTVSGDVLVGVRRGSRVYVDANTLSGSTTSELALGDAPADETPSDENAPLVEVRAKTVSGDISVVRAPAATQITAG